MAKKNKNKESSATTPDVKAIKTTPYTFPELRNNSGLWYKIRVLIYDPHNMTKDKTCENRTLQTPDALYISGPYFTIDEAAAIKTTIVETTAAGTTTTLEQAISKNLENFLEKRRASGDARPCGPHDVGPCLSFAFWDGEVGDYG